MKMEDCMVYFVKAKVLGYIKIGYTETNNFKHRLTSLKASSPDELMVIGIINNAPLSEEKYLHHKFNHLQIRGEWFKGTPELIDYIHSINEIELDTLMNKKDKIIKSKEVRSKLIKLMAPIKIA